MNRKERRAALKHSKKFPITSIKSDRSKPAEIADLMGEARECYRQGRFDQAQNICRNIVARQPAHVDSLNLLGVIAQMAGRHEGAVKLFSKAIAVDAGNAACHYNIASSYQTLDFWDKATRHFRQALALGFSGNDVEALLLQNADIADCLKHVAERWPGRLTLAAFGISKLQAIANDALLCCALETAPVRGVGLERLLTSLRFALLKFVMEATPNAPAVGPKLLRFFCALAQQCFINEYVLVHSDEENAQAQILRKALCEKVAGENDVSPLLIIVVASYFPLHTLQIADALRNGKSSEVLRPLIRQQLCEPYEEAQDRDTIPILTAIEDDVSFQVKQQYEENPYPRWILLPDPASITETQRRQLAASAGNDGDTTNFEILVAGCGTGYHSIQTAQLFPTARVLAVDISLASLAYARRKTREAGLSNIVYCQADLLKLGSLAHTFDRIEVMGVLHHLVDPLAGWRTLLSLLRSGGIMQVGLYSAMARRGIAAARAFITARGYTPSPKDIRACRQELIYREEGTHAKNLTMLTDFYSTSGCRDLLFNVVEHGFTIPDIKVFLDQEGLSFLGFEVDSQSFARFQDEFPNPGALTDLDRWHAFEEANPRAFFNMYKFSIQKA
jgi:2-polyprenyl-3-methyl-5-hydroxy-6-metoxy-1,4-benzoquinol methylase/tetratricopeptide (TPR) repeat protein